MSCCVRTCKKNKSEDTLFHFPVDERLQNLWVTILKENNVVDSDWELTEDSQICINHFNNSCCIKTENDVLLTGEAYPSIFEVDDYLIEEIFEEEGVESIMAASYEEVLPNGDESLTLNNSETDLLGNHVTIEENDFKESEKLTKSVSKLKNIEISSPEKTPIQPKTIDISKRIENDPGKQQKIPMFKVVPEKLGSDTSKGSKDSVFKIVPDDPSPAKLAAPSQPNKKAMQAIQIGNQYYVVSPDTPDGKELTPTQLNAIKEKLLKQMCAKGPQVSKKLTVALENPTKKNSPKPAIQKVLPPKKVTTIDLNKGLPKQLKEIISDKTKRRKIVDDQDAETFTVSSSLDIMPVTPAKKPREDTVILGLDYRVKTADFPGNINGRNMSKLLPVLTRGKSSPDPSTSEETSEAPNRTEFYKMLTEINKQMPQLNKSFWSHVYDQNQIVISKTHVVEHSPPRQILSIVLDIKLNASIYKFNSLLLSRDLSEMNINLDNPLVSWTQLKAIIEKLNLIKGVEDQEIEFGVTDANQYNNYINRAISVCQQIANDGRLGIQEHDQKMVAFICEQLFLLNESKEFRKYSVNLLVFCYILYTTSPLAYESLRKVLIIPDGALLKEIASADISREFIHANEHRMVTLASKTQGFSQKDKVVVLQMYNIKVSSVANMSNVLMFVAASVSKHFAEVLYFCPIQDTVSVTKVCALTLEIIKRLENIGMHVCAFISEYNELTFALFKQLSPGKTEKRVSIPHPIEKRRKLVLLYENSSLLTAICWDWMSKDHIVYPQFTTTSKLVNSNKVPLKASFQTVSLFLKKQKVYVYFKNLNVQSMSLMNQVLNGESVQLDETQKAQFTLSIFQDKLIRALETHNTRDYVMTGDFMRVIYDWWSIVSANTSKNALKDKRFKISDKNREPIYKLNNIGKWVNVWRLQDKSKMKLGQAVFHVLSENCSGYKQLCDSLLKDYNVDQFYLGTFQVSLPGDVGFVSTSLTEQCKFNFK